MKAQNLVKIGGIVYVRYLDHARFQYSNPNNCEPFINEAVGWLNCECDQYIKIVYEWQGNAKNSRNGNGFVILKSDILELRGVG